MDPRVLVLFMADLGMMAFLAILFGETHRFALRERFREISLGLLFGLAGIYSITMHQMIGGTGSINSSTIFVAFAAAFLSTPGALIALLLVIGARFLTADTPEISEYIGFFLAAILGKAWRVNQPREAPASLQSILLLGIGISLTLLPLGQVFGEAVRPDWAVRAVPAAIMAVIATGILGSFIERERRLISVEHHLRSDAHTDPLTGLANRRQFERAFSAMARDGHGSGVAALMLIDVDHFKSINDQHGHAAGDRVLRALAAMLRRLVRSQDVVARLGGEEFGILLRGQSAAEILSAGERLREQIALAPVSTGTSDLELTVSVGLACWTGNPSLDEVYLAADTALYDAKRRGRNRSVLSDLAIGSPT